MVSRAVFLGSWDWDFVILMFVCVFLGGEKDGRTDAMKSCGFPPEETAEEAAAASLVERDGFKVEDLLDLEEFCEPDKDDAEHEEPPPPAVPAAAEEPEKVNWSPDDSHRLSVVNFELPPPPPPEMVDLPVSVASLTLVPAERRRLSRVRPLVFALAGKKVD